MHVLRCTRGRQAAASGHVVLHSIMSGRTPGKELGSCLQVSMLPGAVSQQAFEQRLAEQDKDALTITYWCAACAKPFGVLLTPLHRPALFGMMV